MKAKPEEMWAITGTWTELGKSRTFLYCDTSFTRSDMISKHCSALGKDWEFCRKQGDRAIRVLVSPINT